MTFTHPENVIINQASPFTGNLLAVQLDGNNRLAVDQDGKVYILGKVGLGTTSPDMRLELADADPIETGVEFTNTSAGGKAWRIRTLGSGVGGRIGNFSIRNATPGEGVNVIEIKPTGEVGINTGTNGPTSGVTLHVVGDLIRLDAGTKFIELSTVGGAVDLLSSGAALALNYNGPDILMAVAETAKVGIGTPIPQAKLDVAGGAVRVGGREVINSSGQALYA